MYMTVTSDTVILIFSVLLQGGIYMTLGSMKEKINNIKARVELCENYKVSPKNCYEVDLT
jgi:hypothetical protein